MLALVSKYTRYYLSYFKIDSEIFRTKSFRPLSNFKTNLFFNKLKDKQFDNVQNNNNM